MLTIVLDSSCEITNEEVAEWLKNRPVVKMSMATRPWHHRDGITDREIQIFGLTPDSKFIVNGDSGDSFRVSDKPGNWVTYAIDEERSRICIYGPGFRVVDISLYLRPLHDGHARFGPVLYEAFCRVEKPKTRNTCSREKDEFGQWAWPKIGKEA